MGSETATTEVVRGCETATITEAVRVSKTPSKQTSVNFWFVPVRTLERLSILHLKTLEKLLMLHCSLFG